MNETVGSSRYGRYKKYHDNEIFSLQENASETDKAVSTYFRQNECLNKTTFAQ
jgi:hypothetical protein